MLKVDNLHASVGGKQILNGISLDVKPGEVHAVMGPNGSGKSTLAHVLAGHPNYLVTGGTIKYRNKEMLDMSPFERAREGVFLGFQYPVEIPGVTNMYFLKSALNAAREHVGLKKLDAMEFSAHLQEKMSVIGMQKEMMKRQVNVGFSGGEKKANEIFQMLVLEPRLAILDEPDSGLDIDAIGFVSKGVNHFHNSKNAVILVTHYQRILEFIEPDFVHVLIDGKIAKSGTAELAQQLDERGYDWVRRDLAEAENV